MIRLIHRFIAYLIYKFNYPVESITTVNTVDKVITNEYAVLPYPVYEKLERLLSNTLVSSNTSELEAGYKLGIATALEKLRNGYVVEKG